MLTDQQFYKPAEIAKLLGTDHYKVTQFIHRGELRAVDVSLNRSQKPRWRISREDLEAFLNRRANTPEPRAVRKRKQKDKGVIQFYK